MIDPGHPRLSIVRQCELASISRSSFYREPRAENEETLRLMRLIDEQFLETPWYGSRQMARHLRRNGWCVGRHRVRRLMLKLGLAPIYQRPKTSEPHPQHRIWPYLLPSTSSAWRAAVHRSSPSIASLAAALAKAQAELVNPEKSLVATISSGHRGGPQQSFRYAPLSSGLDIVRKTLGQHEIATVQTPCNCCSRYNLHDGCPYGVMVDHGRIMDAPQFLNLKCQSQRWKGR